MSPKVILKIFGSVPLGGAEVKSKAGIGVVLAFDPGGVTGWASVGVDLENWELCSVPNWGQIPSDRGEAAVAERMAELIDLEHRRAGAGRLAVVTEQFTVRRFDQGREFLSPVRLNACLDWYCWQIELGLQMQQPSLAMTRWTDARLDAAGYKLCRYQKTGGGPHAADALRHALTFVTRLGSDAALRRRAFGHDQ